MIRASRLHGMRGAFCAMIAAGAVILGSGSARSEESEGVLIGVFVLRPHPEVQVPTRETWQTDLRSAAGDRVFFGDGSADLGARARVVLAAQAEWLRQHPRHHLVIEGHADELGGPAFNHSLSQRRAEAVRKRLLDLGIAPERLLVVARGADARVATCEDSVCSAQNRRVLSLVLEPVEEGAANVAPPMPNVPLPALDIAHRPR